MTAGLSFVGVCVMMCGVRCVLQLLSVANCSSRVVVGCCRVFVVLAVVCCFCRMSLLVAPCLVLVVVGSP